MIKYMCNIQEYELILFRCSIYYGSVYEGLGSFICT